MKRIAFDPLRCSLCGACAAACALIKAGKPDLSQSRIRIETAGSCVPLRAAVCRHCEEPACVTACMRGIIDKDAETGLAVTEFNRDDIAGLYFRSRFCDFVVDQDTPCGTDLIGHRSSFYHTGNFQIFIDSHSILLIGRKRPVSLFFTKKHYPTLLEKHYPISLIMNRSNGTLLSENWSSKNVV